jgi:hypothetical protein
MHSVHFIAQCVSIVAFLAYGISCFFSEGIKREFERYRLPRLRKLTGALEIAGALGLLVGFFIDPLRIISAGCLALLMTFAVLARFRINDSFFAMLPALVLLLINVFICTAK